MPKIIENLREQLLAEAKKQIGQRGYSDTTVRSVAGACGVGVGTVYNYFESKEMLIASFVYEDWKQYLEEMASLPSDDPLKLTRGIYESLSRFASEHEALFSDAEASRSISVGWISRHKMLRDQIASFVLPLCERCHLDDPGITSAFIAESLINWSMENADFDTIYPLYLRLLKK